MATRARPWLPWAALAAVLGLLAGWLGLRDGFAFTDYDVEASGAVHLLLGGDVAGFLRHAPAYGGSLVLRAPFAIAPRLWGGGEGAAFVTLAMPALAAVAALGAALAHRARARGWTAPVAGVVVGLALLNPATLDALRFGHAEEAVGAVLCVAATVAAARGRWALAGALLGAAIANKPWAVVAAPVVLLALPRHALRCAAVAAAVAALVLAPLVLAGSSATGGAGLAASSTGTTFKPAQVWWFAGVPLAPAVARAAKAPAGARSAPAWLSRASRPILVLATALLALLWRIRRRPVDALGLLALVLLARCLLDPWNNPYYHLPFILALLAWEVRSARRLPLATMAACLALRMTLDSLPGQATLDVQAWAYLAWALPGLVLLAIAVLAPGRARALAARVGAATVRAMPGPHATGARTAERAA